MVEGYAHEFLRPLVNYLELLLLRHWSNSFNDQTTRNIGYVIIVVCKPLGHQFWLRAQSQKMVSKTWLKFYRLFTNIFCIKLTIKNKKKNKIMYQLQNKIPYILYIKIKLYCSYILGLFIEWINIPFIVHLH